MPENLINIFWGRYKILRMGCRFLVFIFLMIFFIQAFESFIDTKKINYLLLLISEFITVCLVIFSKDEKNTDLSLLAIFSTIGGTFYYILFDFFQYKNISIINPVYGVFIQSVGILMQIISKLSLGLSFGLLPANRGVKREGAYRVVRHPIYASYLVAHIGFVLSFFSLFNVLVLCFNWLCQIVRIFEEERILNRDNVYLKYSQRVRWRLIPGVF